MSHPPQLSQIASSWDRFRIPRNPQPGCAPLYDMDVMGLTAGAFRSLLHGSNLDQLVAKIELFRA